MIVNRFNYRSLLFQYFKFKYYTFEGISFLLHHISDLSSRLYLLNKKRKKRENSNQIRRQNKNKSSSNVSLSVIIRQTKQKNEIELRNVFYYVD
jgi:hypothetical protein